MVEQYIHKLKIDMVFRQLVPPLMIKDLLYLEESIIRDGCHNPLSIWNNIILDGYNRYEICTRLQIPFTIQRIYLKNREEAIAWICKNELKRYNITEEARRYLIGKRCEIEKLLGARHVDRASQYAKKEHLTKILPETIFNPTTIQTRERLCKEHNISIPSIINYEKYTNALDLLSEIVPELVPKILMSDIKISIQNTIALSQLSELEIKNLSKLIVDNPPKFILNLRQILLKKQSSIETCSFKIPFGSIKEMPAYDPDAEVSSLILTIPSWISSIDRARSTSDFSKVTENACHRLEKELTELKMTIDNMLSIIKEVN